MMTIKLLPEEVIEQIAAGEVVERPASVVKELLENSLDADADRIEVNFAGGGVNLIQVSDDGCGIPKNELAMAFKRHATSKINNTADLHKVLTLGFRGEALPSIAAVSRVTITSRSNEMNKAFSLHISAGKTEEPEPAARSGGTTIKVEDLFYNTPARKKFMKSETTEKKNIVSTVESLALIKSDTAFKLSNNGKIVFDIPAQTSMDRFSSIFGKKLKGKIIAMDFTNPFIELTGLITDPSVSYTNKNRIRVYVNGRPVFSPLATHAIMQGCHSFLPPDRFPACVLNILIDPAKVDINVHPSKKEIKFQETSSIHDIVEKVIHRNLSESPVSMDIDLDRPRSEHQHGGSRYVPFASRGISRGFSRAGKTSASRQPPFPDISLVSQMTFDTHSHPEDTRPCGKMIPRFQLKCKYVVAQDDEGILIIDQHTAWERINYEKLKEQFKAKGISSQGTLIPDTIELEPSQAGHISDNIQLLEKFGIHLEEFGPNMFKVTGIPAPPSGDQKDDFETRDMIEQIAYIIDKSGKTPDTSEMHDEIIRMIACKSSVKAGDKMSDEEIKGMLIMLGECTVPHRCPHGRPVIIRITEEELDSKFLR